MKTIGDIGIKVLIVTQCFPPKTGGIQRLVYDLANQLQAIGTPVFVFVDTYKHACTFDQQQSFQIYRFAGLKFWRRWRKRRAVKRLLSAEAIDFILTDSWKSVELIENLVTPPIFSLAHGNEFLTTDVNKQCRILKTSQKVTQFLANSNATADLVTSLGVASAKVKTVYPGISVPDFKQSTILNSQLNLQAGPLLLTVARLEPRKGHQQVLSALKILQVQYPTLQYAIVGEGSSDYLRLLKQDVHAYGLDRQVYFLGRVDQETVSYLYQRAVCFVMPVFEDTNARSIEGFGLVYLEAACHGLPAIAGNSGGAVEAVIDGQTGWVCQDQSPETLAKLIDKCLSAPEIAKRLGEQAQQRVKAEFLWPVAIKRYLKVFKKYSA